MRTLPPHHIHWEQPPQTEEGEESADLLYLPIGRALTHWEQIEEECAMLFTVLVDSWSEAAYRAYGCIIGTPTKREMLSNAAEVFFEERGVAAEDRAPFEALMKHHQQAATKRNEIVHGEVIGFVGGKRFHFFLIPPQYNARKTHPWNPMALSASALNRSKYRYVAKDVDHFSARFMELYFWLGEYRDLLSERYETSRKRR